MKQQRAVNDLGASDPTSGDNGVKKKRKGRNKAAMKASMKRKKEKLAAEGIDIEAQKKEKKEKKAAQAAAISAGGSDQKNKTSTGSLAGKRKRKAETLFFGQLPYDTTEEAIRKKLETVGVTNCTVRMLTDKESGWFRGIAFIDFENEKEKNWALKLHGTTMGKLTITVEKPSGAKQGEEDAAEGAAEDAKKGKKHQAVPSEQLPKLKKQLTDTQIEELIEDAVTAAKGNLSSDDFDEKIRDTLGNMTRVGAEKALNNCVKKSSNREVKNRQAYFMGIISMAIKKSQQKEAAKKQVGDNKPADE